MYWLISFSSFRIFLIFAQTPGKKKSWGYGENPGKTMKPLRGKQTEFKAIYPISESLFTFFIFIRKRRACAEHFFTPGMGLGYFLGCVCVVSEDIKGVKFERWMYGNKFNFPPNSSHLYYNNFYFPTNTSPFFTDFLCENIFIFAIFCWRVQYLWVESVCVG